MKTETYISSERVNTGRQYEIDCVKFFAVIFMVCIHTYEQLSSYDYHNYLPTGFFRNAIEFLGGPMAAPVFMFAMGAGMVFTRHSSPKDFIKRGFKLLAMGFLLNFFRESLLEILGNLILKMDYSFEYIADGFLNIDILHFAGMTFLAAGLMKKAKINSKAMLVIGILFQAVGIWFSRLTFSSVITGNLLGLLFPTGEKVAFPLSLWCLYPFLGILFGEYLQKVLNKEKFYRILIITGSVVSVAMISCLLFIGYDIRLIYALCDNSYYHQNFIGVIFIIPFVVLSLGISYFLFKKTSQTKFGVFISFCSKNLNMIYIIQWLLIAWTVAVLTATGKEPDLNAIGTILVGLFVTSVAILITLLIRKIIDKGSKKQ